MQQANPDNRPSTVNNSADSPKRFGIAALIAAFLAGGLIASTALFSLVASKRLNAKSDDIFSRFSEKLDAKGAAASTQISDIYRRQTEQFTSNSAMLSAQFAAKESASAAQLSNYYRLQTEQFRSNSVMLSAQFAENLNAKADEVATRLSNDFRSQADQALATKAAELMTGISNSLQTQLAGLAATVQVVQLELARPAKERADRHSTLLSAADRFAKESRPELAELCYLSAFTLGGSDSGSALKQFLQWKETALATASDPAILTNGAAMVLAVLQTLDKAIPESKAAPTDMENALAAVERMKNGIAARQGAQLKELDAKLQWALFNPSDLQPYIAAKELLASVSPVSDAVDTNRNRLQNEADNLIQTARSLSPASLADLIPPSPKAPDVVLSNWYGAAIDQLHQPTNNTDAKLAAFTVLHEFTVNNSNLGSCQVFLPQLENEATLLASQQWRDRQEEIANARAGKLKSDAEILAAEQVLLNQGAELVRASSNKSSVALVAESLPTVAKNMFLDRQRTFQDMVRTLPSTEFKEKRARARSMLASQIMAATMELRLVQQDLQKLGCSTSGSGNTSSVLADLEGYLTAFEKEDAAGGLDDRARHLEEQRQQYARYANHCETVISSANRHYEKAAELRAWKLGQITTKWSSDGPQWELKQGLKSLYSIDINDLNRANPGIAAEWSTVEEKLKKEFKGSPSAINAETSKKSLLDFQP